MESLSFSQVTPGDASARQSTIQENLNLVHFVAKQLSKSLSADADLDEMINVGTLGLMAAVESFDASRGLAFSTYAVPRIRGAILDELRRQDHVPRSVRRKARDLAQARESLMHTLGRAPRDSELATKAGLDMDTLWRWQADIERTVQISLESPDSDQDDEGQSPIAFLRANVDAVDERLMKEEQVDELRDALVSLKAQQRTVLTLYYFEELNARQIAQVLGISESRVSQIRSRALAVLRERLGGLRQTA